MVLLSPIHNGYPIYVLTLSTSSITILRQLQTVDQIRIDLRDQPPFQSRFRFSRSAKRRSYVLEQKFIAIERSNQRLVSILAELSYPLFDRFACAVISMCNDFALVCLESGGHFGGLHSITATDNVHIGRTGGGSFDRSFKALSRPSE
jgi:hypothetical protein